MVLIWRRREDLNFRAGYPTYTLSRGASSATWVLLHKSTQIHFSGVLHKPPFLSLLFNYTQFFLSCQYFFAFIFLIFYFCQKYFKNTIDFSKILCYHIIRKRNKCAPSSADRVPGYEPVGREFESPGARQERLSWTPKVRWVFFYFIISNYTHRTGFFNSVFFYFMHSNKGDIMILNPGGFCTSLWQIRVGSKAFVLFAISRSPFLYDRFVKNHHYLFF